MKREIATQWVKALRSGDYKQGTGVLRSSDNRFCCLGVLCEVLREELNLEVTKIPSDYNHAYEYEGSQIALPRKVRDYVRMRSSDGDYDDRNSLAKLNDKGMSFSDLADVIEANMKVL